MKSILILYICGNNGSVGTVWAGTGQTVLRRTAGWTVRGSNFCVGEIFRTYPDRPWGPPSILYRAFGVILRTKEAGAWL